MKRIKYLFLSVIMLLIAIKPVYAGSVSIWASANSVTVGSTVNISINAKSVFGKFNIKTSDASILSGPTSGDVDDGDTAIYTFTAKAAGEVTITIIPEDMADFDTEKEYTQSKSVTIKVVNKTNSNSTKQNNNKTDNNTQTTAEKKEYDSDNTLKSLEVENYQIIPSFNKDTLEYKLEVDESVEKINVKATSNSNKAEIQGIGERKLTPGENTIEVKVTAENGNEKIYKILVTVKDQHPIVLTLDNKRYTVIKKNNNVLEKLEGFEEEIIKIKEQDVVSYINKTTKIRVVILKDENNQVDYYIYNEQTQKYTKYKVIQVGNITLQLLEAPISLKRYKKYQINIKNEKVDIYKIKKTHKVGLVYGTNVKTGNTGYYVYDEAEETLSRYYDEEVKKINNELLDFQNKAMIFMGCISGFVIIIIIISLVKKKRRRIN